MCTGYRYTGAGEGYDLRVVQPPASLAEQWGKSDVRIRSSNLAGNRRRGHIGQHMAPVRASGSSASATVLQGEGYSREFLGYASESRPNGPKGSSINY